MLVKDLVVLLQGMPQEEEVVFQSSDGCCHCNPESFTQLDEIKTCEHKDVGTYPYHEKENFVALESYR